MKSQEVKMTCLQLVPFYPRVDRYLLPEEALELGIVDRIIGTGT